MPHQRSLVVLETGFKKTSFCEEFVFCVLERPVDTEGGVAVGLAERGCERRMYTAACMSTDEL